MRVKPPPQPRPCIITALEIIGLDDPSMPEGRARKVVAAIEQELTDDRAPRLAEHYETHLALAAHRVLHVAPIKRAGMLPFWSALNVLHLQADLIPHGVLVRGAIALGDAAAHGDLVFGHGIAEAERLRDEVAIVPRVILDPRLLREVEQNPNLCAPHHNPMQELGYIHDLLRQDADGLWFVDYLWAFRSEVDEPLLYLGFFKGHRQLVLRRLEASTVLDRSAHASSWLWRYHNRVFEDLNEAWSLDDHDAADLRIPAISHLVYDFPGSAKEYGAP